MNGDPIRYRLTVAYDGTDFSGWQKQEPPDPAAPPDENGQRPRVALRTVQHVIERAARAVLREPGLILTGASRTDSGVHAAGQVAAFTTVPDASTGRGWPIERGALALVRAINSRLPDDVMILSARAVGLGFDPIRGAERKAYTYTMHSGPSRPMWDRRYVYWTWHALDVGRMDEAARHLEGEHDFASFAQAGHGRQTTVRRIFSCRVLGMTGEDGSPRAQIRVEGSGFLYNMVRIIAGTLLEVGRGRTEPGAVPGILGALDRRAAGPTLPPEGLRLEWVRYAGDEGPEVQAGRTGSRPTL